MWIAIVFTGFALLQSKVTFQKLSFYFHFLNVGQTSRFYPKVKIFKIHGRLLWGRKIEKVLRLTVRVIWETSNQLFINSFNKYLKKSKEIGCWGFEEVIYPKILDKYLNAWLVSLHWQNSFKVKQTDICLEFVHNDYARGPLFQVLKPTFTLDKSLNKLASQRTWLPTVLRFFVSAKFCSLFSNSTISFDGRKMLDLFFWTLSGGYRAKIFHMWWKKKEV